jgi:hypothetical protein
VDKVVRSLVTKLEKFVRGVTKNIETEFCVIGHQAGYYERGADGVAELL